MPDLFTLVLSCLEFLLTEYWNQTKETDRDEEIIDEVKAVALQLVTKTQDLRVIDQHLLNNVSLTEKMHFKKLFVMVFLVNN